MVADFYYAVYDIGYSRTKTAVCCGGDLPVCVQILSEYAQGEGSSGSSGISTYYTCCAEGADCCPAGAQMETDPLGRTRCWTVEYNKPYDYFYNEVGGLLHPIQGKGKNGGWYEYYG